jgi:hypothetical protein
MLGVEQDKKDIWPTFSSGLYNKSDGAEQENGGGRIRPKKTCALGGRSVEVAVLTFSSTHAALQAERRLKEKGFCGELVPVPREISASCGLAWLGKKEDVEEARAELDASGVEVEGLKVLSPEAAARWAWLLSRKDGE